MIRTLATVPSPRSWDTVTSITAARFPGLPVGFVTTGANAWVAVYSVAVLDPTAVAAWQAAVTAHDPNAVTPAMNAATLRDRGIAALDANATFLALAAPTNAQVVAHVQRLTRECSGLIRLELNQLDDTTGT